MHGATIQITSFGRNLEKALFTSYDLCDFSDLARSIRVNKLKSIHCPD